MTPSEQVFTGTGAEQREMACGIVFVLWDWRLDPQLKQKRQAHVGTQKADEKEPTAFMLALMVLCPWLSGDLHMHTGFICSLLITHARCAHCHQCRKAVCLLGSGLICKAGQKAQGRVSNCWTSVETVLPKAACTQRKTLVWDWHPLWSISGQGASLSLLYAFDFIRYHVLQDSSTERPLKAPAIKRQSSNAVGDKFHTVSPKYPLATVMSPRVEKPEITL